MRQDWNNGWAGLDKSSFGPAELAEATLAVDTSSNSKDFLQKDWSGNPVANSNNTPAMTTQLTRSRGLSWNRVDLQCDQEMCFLKYTITVMTMFNRVTGVRNLNYTAVDQNGHDVSGNIDTTRSGWINDLEVNVSIRMGSKTRNVPIALYKKVSYGIGAAGGTAIIPVHAPSEFKRLPQIGDRYLAPQNIEYTNQPADVITGVNQGTPAYYNNPGANPGGVFNRP